MKAVANQAAALSLKDVTTRTTPIGSCASNGAIERYFSSLHGQIRVLRQALQADAHVMLEPASVASTWLVRHASWLLARYRTWHGQTPYFREHGVEYHGPVSRFGKRVWARVPRALNQRKWDPRWFEGR